MSRTKGLIGKLEERRMMNSRRQASSIVHQRKTSQSNIQTTISETIATTARIIDKIVLVPIRSNNDKLSELKRETEFVYCGRTNRKEV